jgi:hypothetical protein
MRFTPLEACQYSKNSSAFLFNGHPVQRCSTQLIPRPKNRDVQA